MNDFLRWLLDNGPSIALIMIAVTVILMYLVASFQRRAVSFWPPRIEGRPLDTSNRQDSSTSVIYAIQNRKSVRTFLDRPVEEEKLNRVLEAARLAPSASNRQEWRFVIIRGKATRKKIGTATSMVSTFVEKCPVLIAACAETDGHVMQCG
jgi:hypothetical protein